MKNINYLDISGLGFMEEKEGPLFFCHWSLKKKQMFKCKA